MRMALFLSMMLATACDPNKACTEIGCMSGITVSVYDSYGAPSDSAYGTLSIVSDSMDEPLSFDFDCREADSGGALCSDNTVTFIIDDAEALPDDAMYLYTINTNEVESFSDTGDLIFTESRPNGEGCPPTCYDMQLEAEMMRPIDDGDGG